MNIRIETHTPHPMETLIWTKGTRLQAEGLTLEEVLGWPEEKKLAEWEYMKGTIQSSWEFFQVVFMIQGVSRAFTHQLVRHRIGTSFAQQTHRAIDLSTFDYITGPSVLADNDRKAYWDLVMDQLAGDYANLIELGVNRNDARGVIPTNVSTSIIFGTNLRTLHEMAKVRLCVKAQGEFQDVFREIKRLMVERWPWTEDVLQVQCGLTGTCAFPNYPMEDCPTKPYVYNPLTARAYGGGAPRTLRVLRSIHERMRAEAQPGERVGGAAKGEDPEAGPLEGGDVGGAGEENVTREGASPAAQSSLSLEDLVETADGDRRLQESGRFVLDVRPIARDIIDCSRCGESHDDVRFRKLVNPIVMEGFAWPWEGRCPTTDEVIIMRLDEEDGDSEEVPAP